MEVRFFTNGPYKTFIREENGSVSEMIYPLGPMTFVIENYKESKKFAKREHGRWIEITQEEYTFWREIILRIKEFRETHL